MHVSFFNFPWKLKNLVSAPMNLQILSIAATGEQDLWSCLLYDCSCLVLATLWSREHCAWLWPRHKTFPGKIKISKIFSNYRLLKARISSFFIQIVLLLIMLCAFLFLLLMMINEGLEAYYQFLLPGALFIPVCFSSYNNVRNIYMTFPWH